jgi:hypothetical protein
MANSYVLYNGNGSTQNFTVPFGYLDQDHVTIEVSGVEVASTWVNSTTIRATVAPAAGTSNVKVKRSTPKEALATFSNSSQLNVDDLNTQGLQYRYIAEEQEEAYLAGGLTDLAVATSNLADLAVTTEKLGTASVTLAKMADLSARVVIGRTTGSGVPEAISPDNLKVVATSSTTERTLASRFAETWNVKDFGAIGDGTTDDTSAITAALAAMPGTNAIGDYTAVPNPILFFPAGIYKVSSRILVTKGSTCIRGAGQFSTTIKYVGSAIINEVIKFRDAEFCELSDIGLDGGLPYNPTLSETYGAKAGLACDLTPFFTSRNLYIANTRLQGIRAIHLWESYFSNLQVRNTGYFSDGTLAGRGAAIHFSNDAAQKESSDALGSGYESSNVTFIKAKLVPVGCVVRCDVGCANITFVDPITENRDFAAFFYALGESKYYISDSANFRILGGYYYGHEHTFACDAKLFEIVAQKPGVVIKDFYWYCPRATGGSYQEVTKAFDVDPVYPVTIEGLTIDDENGQLITPCIISTNGPRVVGSIIYKSNSTVLPTALFSGTGLSRWEGKIRCIDSTTPASLHTEWDYTASMRSFDYQSGASLEAFQCRAWVRFDGSSGAIAAAKNVSGVTRNSAGNYTVTFTNSLPDANYAAIPSCNASATGGERALVAGQATGSCNLITLAGTASYADCSLVTLAVFR